MKVIESGVYLLNFPALFKSIAMRLMQHHPFQKIRFRLSLTSIFLSVLMVVSFYFISQTLSKNLAVKEQVNFELNSFKQMNQHITLILTNLENKIWKTNTNPVITQSFSIDYNDSNIYLLPQRYFMIKSSLNSLFNEEDYLDDVIIIGKNNTIFFYGPDQSLTFESQADGFDFSGFMENTDLKQYLNGLDSPFYYKKGYTNNPDDVYGNILYDLMDRKIVYIHTVRNTNQETEGIIIMTLKSQFITDSIHATAKDHPYYVFDNLKNILWSSPNGNQLAANQYKSFLTSKSGTFQAVSGKIKYIFTYDFISPFNFYILEQTPFESAVSDYNAVRNYALTYGFLCILYTLLVSYFFSKRLCAPIHMLADNFSKNTLTVSGHLDSSYKIPLKNYSLRNAFILYFVITVIFPAIFYMSALTYMNYGIYKSRILAHAFDTINYVKSNVDYKLSYLDEFVKNLAFDDNIQSLPPISLSSGISQDQKASLDKLFLNFKILNNDLLAINLYDPKGNNFYSSLDTDNFSIKNTSSDFFEQMSANENKLVYLGSFDKLYNRTTSLLFARALRSYKTGRYFGYITISVDQTALSNMIRSIALGDSGYFFIMDRQGKIFSHDNENQTFSIFNENNNDKTMDDTQGSYQFTFSKKDYFAIYDSSEAFGFKAVGIAPINEILSKVLPLVWYSIIILFIYAVIFLIASYFISYSITKPLTILKTNMAEVEKGNLDISIAYNVKNEIGILIKQFNKMVTRLNELITENYQSKLRESELMFLEKEAQFNALQQQINPHFLYNTLDSIKWMAYKKGAIEVYDMTVALGEFFRGSITRGKELITIGEEIEHLEKYIYIQKVRFQEKFDVVWEIDDSLKEYKTVKLVLQPIVENAINHGIDSMEQGGLIAIKCFKSEEMIRLEIHDNGKGIAKEQLEELVKRIKSSNQPDKKSSIGLSNVYKRLMLYFNSHCSFEISSRVGLGTVVKIVIPILQ